AVKAVEGRRIAGFMRSHGAPVSAAKRGRQAPEFVWRRRQASPLPTSGRECGLELVDEVGALPREGVAVGGAAEMTIGGGLPIDRLVEPQMRADALGRQADEPGDRGFD